MLFLEGREILQTPSISIGPWQEKEVQGIVNIEKESGTYPGTLKLFYEGESKEEAIILTIFKKIDDTQEKLQQKIEHSRAITQVFMVSSIIIVLILLGYIFYQKKKSNGENNDL